MQVIINCVKVEKTYEEVCEDLGFIADVHFVRVTSANTIAAWAGKPDEVKALLHACEAKGYKPAQALIRAARR